MNAVEESDNMMPEKPPIVTAAFVIGSMRSGSTLLRYLIDTHAHLACPPESKFILALENILNAKQVLPALLSLGVSRTQLYEMLGVFITGILDNYSRSVGKVRWVDKTPSYYRILPFLEDVFAHQARFVFLVRHPLDTICSLDEFTDQSTSHDDPDVARITERFGRGRYAWAMYWNDVYQRVLCFAGAHPERSHIVRYEELVQRHERCVQQIVAFLGESPDLLHLEQAFTMQHTRGFRDPKILSTAKVHKSSVGRSAEMTVSERRALWALVKETAEPFGYSLSGFCDTQSGGEVNGRSGRRKSGLTPTEGARD